MEDFVKGHKLGGDGFLSSIVMSPPTSQTLGRPYSPRVKSRVSEDR